MKLFFLIIQYLSIICSLVSLCFFYLTKLDKEIILKEHTDAIERKFTDYIGITNYYDYNSDNGLEPHIVKKFRRKEIDVDGFKIYHYTLEFNKDEFEELNNRLKYFAVDNTRNANMLLKKKNKIIDAVKRKNMVSKYNFSNEPTFYYLTMELEYHYQCTQYTEQNPIGYLVMDSYRELDSNKIIVNICIIPEHS